MKKLEYSSDRLVTDIGVLVSHRSIPGNTNGINGCYEAISQQFQCFGFTPVEYNHNGVRSVVWSNDPGNLSPTVVLSAHVDVVPAPDHMFTMTQSGNRIFGRGVSDMKFSIPLFKASLIETENKTHRLPSIAVMLTSDEEVGGANGVNHLVNDIGYRPSVVIIPDGGDPTHFVSEAKGVLHLRVSSTGKSAHASTPWEGINAINKVVIACNSAQKLYPTPESDTWTTTLNIGKINGGKQTNQVPDAAEAFIDIRFTVDKDPNRLISQIQKAAPGCQVDLVVRADAFRIDREDKHIKLWQSASGQTLVKEAGASDGRYFTAHGIPVIVSKPLGGGEHSLDEWTNIYSVLEFRDHLTRFLVSLI